MNKSTKQTLLSSWIRRGAADGQAQVVSLAPVEKRKREEPEPEEKKRAASLSDKAADDAEEDGDGRRDVDRDGKNAPPPPASPSSSSEGEPDLDGDVANDDDDDDHENEHGVDEHGLTAYEREREALIARNRQALAALGVASAARALACRENADAAAAAAAAAQKRRRASSKKRRAGASKSSAAAFPEEIAARRSSLRPRRGGVAVAGGAGKTAAATTKEGEAAAALGPPLRLQRTPTPEPETYDNRIVLSYIVDGSRRREKAREEEEARTSPPRSSSSALPLPSSLRRLPLVLSGPVVRAYSVSASGCGSLLAAGGKDGWACIWGLRGLGDEQRREERGEEERENNEEDGEKDEEEEEEEEGDRPERAPLLSARLHRSWIADVALVSSSSNNNNNGNGGGAAAAPLLLTAANDGTLAVHDTGAAAELKKKNGGKKEQGADDDDDADNAPAAAPAGAPRRLASATPHAGSGIFSMAVNEFSSSGESHFFFDVATASKDGSLAVSRVENRGGEVKTLATIEDAHGGAVAKCVRWRDGVTLASCGNDGAARLWDVRCPSGGGGGGGGRGGIGGGGGGAAVEIAEATVGGVAANVLRWRPGESGNSAAPPNHLLVAGTNSEALMFDVRRPREPLFSLKPPPPPPSGSAAGGGGGKSSSSSVIYQPCFVARGRAVAVGLPRSRVVSLFDAADGTPLSRGDVGGHDASTLASFGAGGGGRGGAGGEEVVAAVGTKCLHLFSPRF